MTLSSDQLHQLVSDLDGPLPQQTAREVLRTAMDLLTSVWVLEKTLKQAAGSVNHMGAVLTRIATHESLDEITTDGVFGVDAKSVEFVRDGLVDAGYLKVREIRADPYALVDQDGGVTS